jgi:23S rRNA pseudouridine2457 synthase
MKPQYQYIIFNKPYGVLCQFTGEACDRTLSDFNLPKDVYPAGRLDKDSEGLLLLTNDGIFNQKVTNPKSNKFKTYWVQVERIPSEEALNQLRNGVKIKDYITKPCKVKIVDISIEERDPPIRFRKNVPTCWLEISIQEGKNRQVRRMTANINHPTLRLIRIGIGKYNNTTLNPGEWINIAPNKII